MIVNVVQVSDSVWQGGENKLEKPSPNLSITEPETHPSAANQKEAHLSASKGYLRCAAIARDWNRPQISREIQGVSHQNPTNAKQIGLKHFPRVLSSSHARDFL